MFLPPLTITNNLDLNQRIKKEDYILRDKISERLGSQIVQQPLKYFPILCTYRVCTSYKQKAPSVWPGLSLARLLTYENKLQ